MARLNFIVRGGADFSSINNSIKQTQARLSGFQNSTSKSMSFIGTAIKSALAYVGVRALFNFGKSAVEVASNLVEVQNVVDVAFGSMAGSVNDFAENSIEAFGLSELSAKKYTAYLGAMLKSSGITGEAVKDMSLSLTEHVADMASFYNLPYDEMFDKLMGGMAGAVKPLRVLGVNMTIANMESYALSQGITKSWKAMSQAEKTMLRYNYLMSATNDSSGDFVRTQHTWANQIKILQQKWKAFSAELGQGLINILIHVVRGLNKVIEGFIVAGRYFREFTALIFGSADVKSKGVVIDNESIEEGAEGMNDFEESAKEAKKTLMGFDEINQLDSITDDAGNIGDAFGDIPVADVGEPIKIDVDVSAIKTKFEELKTGFLVLFEPIKTAWDNFVTNTTPKMQTWAAETWQSIKISLLNLGSVFETIGGIWLGSLGKYKPQITKNIEDTLTNIQETFTTVGTILTEMWESWTSGMAEFTSENKGEVKSFTDRIVGYFTGAWATLNAEWKFALVALEVIWNKFGKPMFGKLSRFITDIFEGIIKFVNGVFLGDWEKALEGIAKIFETMFWGLATLVTTPLNVVIDIINGWISQLNTFKIPEWLQKLTGLGGNFNIGLIGHIKNPLDDKGALPIKPGAPPPVTQSNLLTNAIGNQNGLTNFLNLADPIASAVGTSVMSAIQFVQSNERKGTNTEVNINIDGNKLAKVMLPKLNKETERLGLKTILQTN